MKPWKPTAARRYVDEHIVAVDGRAAVNETWSASSKQAERALALEASAETINSRYPRGTGPPSLDADLQILSPPFTPASPSARRKRHGMSELGALRHGVFHAARTLTVQSPVSFSGGQAQPGEFGPAGRKLYGTFAKQTKK